MTVENDGLPPSEDDDREPVADGTLDPLTESLPLDAATATKLAAADAAARQAQLTAPDPPPPADAVVADEPTQVLPVDPRAGRPAQGTPAEGSMEGDLFDGGEPTGRDGS
jgi:hypothetical protein